MGDKKGIIEDKSFDFALRIIRLNEHLQKSKRQYVIAKQILKAGTSIGANISEAVKAESKADFIHKLGISKKECGESIFWLKLLVKSKICTEDQIRPLLNDAEELLKMLRSSILTANNNK